MKKIGCKAGFSLVELVVAIGIFSFCAVAILSLLSVALKIRADSALETRGAIIASDLFSSIRMTGGLKTATFRDGPALEPRNNQVVDLTKDSVAIGYPLDTTVPFGLWHSARGQDPKMVWETGNLEPWAIANQIQTLAYVYSKPVNKEGLYQVFCEIRTPATLPLSKSRVNTYSTLMSSL